MANPDPRSLAHDDYGVAIVCPLEVEMSAVRYMLDEEYTRLPSQEGDSNRYVCGRMGRHNVVIAYLPQGSQGIGAAAAVATDMKRTFPKATLRLLVGIGGGIPSTKNDIRLGDVVVSMPTNVHGGVVQYDLGKETITGFERKGFLEPPPTTWRTCVVEMQSDHRIKDNRIATFVNEMIDRYPRVSEYAYPNSEVQDMLFLPDTRHVADQATCELCNQHQLVKRNPRANTDPRIFYGLIASGNLVMKNAKLRDQIAGDAGGALCFEMEAAGLMNDFRCIVIRGIADYADSHKNDEWHPYAAAVAAGCAKELLTYIDPVVDTHAFGRNKYWTVTQATNPCFTGRTDDVATLANTIQRALQDDEREQQCRIVITGMGGQGKSEICLRVANRVRSKLWGVFWVDVNTSTSAESGFHAIAARLNISASLSPAEVCQHLANTKQPWLLILDNADDKNFDYQQYFPSGCSGVIMLTSRNPECHYYATAPGMSLDGLPASDAITLLTQVIGKTKLQSSFQTLDQTQSSSHSPNQDQLRDLESVAVSLLKGHPLAIIQAGAYISQGHCSIAEYPQVFELQRKQLLTFRPDKARSRYGDVYATFEASAEALQSSAEQAASDALQLLSVLSMFASSPLPLAIFEAVWNETQIWLREMNSSSTATGSPRELKQPVKQRLRARFGQWRKKRTQEPGTLEEVKVKRQRRDPDYEKGYELESLTRWHVEQLLTLLNVEEAVWNSFRMTRALHLLEVYSLVLVTDNEGFKSLSMHPLAHAWAKDRQELTSQQQSWLRACCLVGVSRHSSIWQKYLALRPHLPPLLSIQTDIMLESGPQGMIARLLYQILWLLLNLRLDKELFELCQQMFTWLKQDIIVVNKQWWPLYYMTALSFERSGRMKESIKLLEQIVGIQKQTLAEDHPSRLASQHELASAYKNDGRVKDATALLEHVVRIQDQTLAEDHPSRLASQQVLANAYMDDGRMKDAIALLEHVVRTEEHRLVEDHPDRLASQHVLAGAYVNDGRVKDAIALFEHVVRTEEQILAEDHPSRLASQHGLARAYKDDGRVKDAIALLEHVVRIQEQTLTEDHPDRLTSQQGLAVTLWEDGQHSLAYEKMQQVAKHTEKLGVRHRARIATEESLENMKSMLGIR